MKKIFVFSVITMFLDQIIKFIIKTTLRVNTSVTVINNFFEIYHVKNDGAAWSLFSGNRLFLIIITILALLFIIKYLIPKDNIKNKDIIIYGTLIGGILGNFIDRLIFGSVTDYLSFTIFNYNYPVFNLADMFIVISIILIVYNEFKEVRK